jgi:N-acetylmuramoyl-L-alanine amidase
MTKDEMLNLLSDPEIVGLTIWAEARAESLVGRIAVACVIRNRFLTGRYSSWRQVCLKKLQFSCWNDGTDRNHLALMREVEKLAIGIKPENLILRNCMWIAGGVMSDAVEDVTLGSTHYYSPEGMVPRNSVPSWAKNEEPRAVLGRHLFYKVA